MTSTGPLVSVIIPLHNGAGYIGATLDSLLAQTDRDFEVVVVDDGSTDNGADLADAHPLRPRVVKQQNLGVAAARNRGVLGAQGTWLAFLDQDDLWHRERISRIRSVLENTEAGCVLTTVRSFAHVEDRPSLEAFADGSAEMVRAWVAGDAALEALCEEPVRPVDAAGTSRRLVTLEGVMGGTVSPTTSFFVRPDHLRLAGGWSLHARSIDDWWLMASLAALEPIELIDDPTHLYRIHTEATSRSTKFWYAYASSLIAMRFGGNYVPLETALSEPLDNLTVWHMATDVLRTTPAQSPRGSREFTWCAMALLEPGDRKQLLRVLLKSELQARAPRTAAAVRGLRMATRRAVGITRRRGALS